jgi:hypothetical protein
MAQAQGSSGRDGMSTAAAAEIPQPKHHKKNMSAKGSGLHKKVLKRQAMAAIKSRAANKFIGDCVV